MSLLSSFVALIAALVGAAAAAADGALLRGDEDRRTDTSEEPSLRPWREHSHRALTITMLLSLLVTGAATALALGLPNEAPAVALLESLLIVAAALIFVEAIPRAIGNTAGAPLAGTLYPFVRVLETLLKPLVSVSFALDRGLRRAFPVAPPSETEREDTAERFRQVVQAEAEIPAEQQAILDRVFGLGQTEVQEIMVPRVDIVALEHDAPWSEVLERVRSSEHSRLPVYRDSIDHIIGVLHAKDLVEAVASGNPPEDWISLLRPAAFIPESKTADAQLRDFRRTGLHIAIVVDEYGGTAGLVTFEDVLEEIVGDIRDEYDREEAPIEARDDRFYWVAGKVSLDELSETLGYDFERDDVTTVGGLVFDALGRLPRSGDELTINGFRVVVERVIKRRVERVYFERLGKKRERAAR
ncbi:MAG TPA: hemolysin family protein [Gemmatimonadaceae bacterium]|nr:hemolysin family protein [Gemmatimonadaceae bacterium]